MWLSCREKGGGREVERGRAAVVYCTKINVGGAACSWPAQRIYLSVSATAATFVLQSLT